MPSYLSWVNYADTATLSTTSGTMQRPLTELQVPWAKGLARGPESGTSTAYLKIRADLGAGGANIHQIGIVGLQPYATTALLRASMTAFGNIEVWTQTESYVPSLFGSDAPIGAAIWFQAPTLAGYTMRYVEIEIEVYSCPVSFRHVDVRRLLIVAGGGSDYGFDRGWSLFSDDTSEDVQTARGGVFISQEQVTRVMAVSMTGRKKVEMRDAVRGFYNYDCLERVLVSCGKRKEIVVAPRFYSTQFDAVRHIIYGRLQSWSPIVHESGDRYSCDNITVKEIPYPPL